MFTVAERERIRDGLVRAASEDERITAAAFLGSAATNREDRWSDIDLAVRIRSDLDPEMVARHWTERMYADHDVVHHLDVWAGPALYRVFLLSSTLQVDLSFWRSRAFAASGPAFRLLFPEAIAITGNAKALLQLRAQIDRALKGEESYPFSEAVYQDVNGTPFEVAVKWARSKEEMWEPGPKPQKTAEELPWAERPGRTSEEKKDGGE